MRTTTRNLVATAIGLLLAMLIGSVAWAQTTITVTDLSDPISSVGGCTLRDAINLATTDSTGDSDSCIENGGGTPFIIQFSLTGTIELTSTLPTISGDVTINGPTTAPGITISGRGAVGVLSVGGSTILNLNDLTIADGNVGEEEQGAAIINGFDGSAGTVNVTGCTFLNNVAGLEGGAIANLDPGKVTVTNSTFSGNSAPDGGAIANEEGTLNVTNSTFSGNSASNGGTILNSLGTANFKGTILAANTGGNCSVSDFPQVTDDGYNVSDDGSCGFSKTGSANNGDGVTPLLDALAANGGPTETFALQSTSPAINAIPLASCTDFNNVQLTTDQRGDPRPGIPSANACDAGAYEYQQPTSTPFAYYQATLVIDLPETFLAAGDFTPAKGSPAINLTTQAVTLTLSSSGFAPESVTIPAGSFKKSLGQYVFTGKVGGVDVAALITSPVKNSYGFSIGATGFELRGITNRVTVTLQVGTNTGTANVKAAIF